MTEYQTIDLDFTSLVVENGGGARGTVLAVDDNPGMLEVVSLVLESGGYQVLQAPGGEAALSVLETIRPDLIVSDVMMPQMDGFSLYRQVRANASFSRIPFIFLTAKAQRTDVRRGMELGADDYLSKPFEPQELVSAVEARLARAAETGASVDQASADLKKTITRVITHELRTPLALLYGYTELLDASGPGMDEADWQTILGGLYSGSRRLMRIVENLVLLSRIESGALAEEIGETSCRTERPDQVLCSVLDQYSEQASANNIALTIDASASGRAVAMNEAHLAEIARQLVDNAIKFSKARAGQVAVTTQQNGDAWLLTVTDHGVGVRRDALPWIFEAFRQADRDEMEQQGTGLGLAIVRGLAEVYGGHVAVESKLGCGSTFTVQLPSISDGPSLQGQG